MADYIYKTTLFHQTSDVAGIPSTNTADLLEFMNNHRSEVIDVSGLVVGQISFDLEKSYQDFDDLIVAPIEWGDVKCVVGLKSFDLYLITNEPL